MRQSGPMLVPLDGSELAEGALPYAVALADALHERIVLLSAWEGPGDELAGHFPELESELRQKAGEYFSEYLAGVRARLGGGDRVAVEIVQGPAAPAILDAVAKLEARMLVIATHGRSGFGRWLYGSTAGRVLRDSPIPVVGVGPQALRSGRTEVRFRHLMVPLDGSSLAESALPVTQALATSAGARVSLVRAVQWAIQAYPYTLPGAYLPQVDEALEAGAKEYLRRQEGRLRPLDVDAFIVRGSAADALVDFVAQREIDLVVMTTHARGGVVRAALGSTADRMLQSNAPVMLLPPEAVGA